MRSAAGIGTALILIVWLALMAAILVALHGSADAFSSHPSATARMSGGTAVHRLAATPTRASRRASSRRLVPPEVNVYAATTSTRVPKSLANIPERVYVPDSGDGTVSVINPRTYAVVDRFAVGAIPHHIAPSWDLKHLYIDNEGSSSLTVIDPQSGRPTGTIGVPYPYNLYFTPDGRKAVVVVERLSTLDFRDPHTWRLLHSVYLPWPGVDHLDFSADGSYLLATTEWSGMLVKIDTVRMRITGILYLQGLPIDVRLAPDGNLFYVTNQGRNGVSIVDGRSLREIRFIPTERGAHGLAVSRDTRSLYVSNRPAGSISVISFAQRRVIATWHVGGSPDMLQVSPNGRELWASNRFDGTIEVIDTRSGAVLHRIGVGPNPHGLSYFPNVGRFSIGHNGVYR